MSQANFLPLGWEFWRAVWFDRNLPTLAQKLVFVWVIHRLKWAIASAQMDYLTNPGSAVPQNWGM